MRQLLALLILMVAAVALSLSAKLGPKQLAIFNGVQRIDMSLTLAILLLLIFFILFYGLIRAVQHGLSLPQRVQSFREARRREGAHRALRDAVVALAEGRYSKVERLAQDASVEPLDADPAALLAALAAQRLQEYDRRDRWLKPLLEPDHPLSLAANLVYAEGLAQQQQFPAALDAIAPLVANKRRNARALQVALRIYQAAERWQEVLRVVRLLANRNALSPQATERLTTRAYGALISRCEHDAQPLMALLKSAQVRELGYGPVVVQFASAFTRLGVYSQARQLLESSLLHRWDSSLADMYGQVCADQPQHGLQYAERWLFEHPNDAGLLRSLAQLCMAQQLWGKALTYALSAYEHEPSPAMAAVLANVYEQHGDLERQRHYEGIALSGLRAMVG